MPTKSTLLRKVAALPIGHQARFYAATDPVALAHLLGEELWSGQEDILRSVWGNRRTYVRACHSSGKTHVAARAIGGWVLAHQPDVLVVVLTPGEDQFTVGMWREVGMMFEHPSWKRVLPGWLGQKTWKIGEDVGQVLAIGRSPKPERPGTLQGLHHRNLLLVIDESPEVDDRLWESARSLLTGDNTRLLALGNPTSASGWFRAAFGNPPRQSSMMQIGAFSTPNLHEFTAEDPDLKDRLLEVLDRPAVAPGLIDPAYVLDTLERGTPFDWRTRVLAEFPEQDDYTLIPRDWIERARRDDRPRRTRVEGTKITAGVDIARMGSDRCVLVARLGGVVFEPMVWGQVDLMVTSGKLAAWMRDNAPQTVWIDEGGMGIGVVDRLAEQGFPVQAFKHNQAPRNAIKFDDRRTEYWWGLRTAFERDEVDLSQLGEEAYRTMAEELSAPRYDFTSAGKLRIEQKARTKERLKRSPDLADALVYAGWSAAPAVKTSTF